MKFTKDDYNSLRQAVINKVELNQIDVKATFQHYYDNGIGDRPAIRLCWDLFWLSKWSKNDTNRSKDYKDIHIETAMKKILKEMLK